MHKSIVEKVLGVSNPYVQAYLDDTLRLTRSITVHSKSEAAQYNSHLLLNYRKKAKDYDKSSWRYYKHLAGEYHEVDVPMKVVSRDTREEIVLNKHTLSIHIETLRELQEFGYFYSTTLEKYPEQGLLLKSLISTSDPIPMEELIRLPDWKIVSYNANLIEPQEGDIIPRLQGRIDRYSRKGMLLNYAISNSLYLATLISSLYHFIFANILILRFGNIKTNRVHSFHLLSYLASHHGLEDTYDYLDDYQRLYLYRNLKYLDSHAGKNSTLDKLVDVFFDRKRMSVTNYEFLQLMDLRDDLSTDYRFIQTLINKTKYSYNRDRFDIEDMRDMEIRIHEGNIDEYTYNMDKIDFRMLNSLTNNVKTKDLEVNLNDDSNAIRNKLYDIALDYWAVTNHLGYNMSLITLIDPVSGTELFLTSKEAHQLYLICVLYMADCSRLEKLPDWNVHRVFKDDRASFEELLSIIGDTTCGLPDILEEIWVQAPRYSYISTKSDMRRFIEKVHKYELGMELFLDSTGDLAIYLEFMRFFENLHTSYTIDNENLDIAEFVGRLELDDFMEYTKDDLMSLATALFDAASDNVMEHNEIYRLTQQAVLKILSKFKSYTTQVLNNFHIGNRELAGRFTPRSTISGYGDGTEWLVTLPPDLNCHEINEGTTWVSRRPTIREPSVGQKFGFEIDINPTKVADFKECIFFEALGNRITVCVDEELSTPDSILTEEKARKLFEQERKLNNG